MANIDGRWDCVIRTPLGVKQGVLSVSSTNHSFTGELNGSLGAKGIEGDVDGDTIMWEMGPGSTLPFKVECRATVEGDRLEGMVTTRGFGSFPMSGTRL